MADVLASAVRLPTPPPGASYSPERCGPRKRSPPSRSPSPQRRRSPPRHGRGGRAGPLPPSGSGHDNRNNYNDGSPDERERMLLERFRPHEEEPGRRKPMTAEEKQAAAKAEYEKLLTMRSGGTYMPPARLRALQCQITDKTSKEYQRMGWEALKKSINGLINKVNVSNIKHIVPELFGENLIRGRGLFCRSIMKAQAASLPFTPIYAAMAAIVNTKLPQVGQLLLQRLVVQFRKAFKRNDKAVCVSSTAFIAHLCNQQVVNEALVAQILLLLLHKPTDDSVEIAVGITREVGQHLEEMSQPIALAVFDQFRSILHEADIDKRVQYMVEVLFQVRKDQYKDNPAIKDELDLVEEEDQITHQIDLDDDINVQDSLNVFKFDPEWEQHEAAYRKLKAEILGQGSDDDDDDDGDDDDDDDSEDSDGDGSEAEKAAVMEIKDQSNTDLVNLRRTIYLTIMSSLDFEEACHKLMKIQLPPGQEAELPSMIVECCSQEKTYSKFFGLIGERFAKLNRMWLDLFEQAFAKYYDTIHRYETNRLRNIARFFGHLLSTDAIGWHVLSVIHLNEDETTSSSRIFIKILFQDLAEALGLGKLQERFKDEIMRPSYHGLFPTDNPRNTRFSINYFTSIGMGVLTEEMRQHLKNLPQPAPPRLPAPAHDHASDSESVSSYSSYSSYSSSYSSSRSPSPASRRGQRGRNDRDRSRSRSRSRSLSQSRSRPGSRSVSSSRSHARRPTNRRYRRSPSHSRSRSRSRSRSSYSASPPPRRQNQGRGRSLTRSIASYSGDSRSPSPAPRPRTGTARRSRGADSDSQSPSRTHGQPGRAPSESASRMPPPRRRHQQQRQRQRTASLSPSPPRRRRSPSYDRLSGQDDRRRREPDSPPRSSGGAGGGGGGGGGGGSRRAKAADFI